jgi:hypothetical protein
VRREPITTPPIPTAPPLGSLALQLALGLGALFVLFVLPPCASSPTLDLGMLAALAAWAAWRLVRWLRRPFMRPESQMLPPRPPPAGDINGQDAAA